MRKAVVGSEARRGPMGARLFHCLGAVVVALLLVASPAGKVAHAEALKVGLISDLSGFGDMGFNWMSLQGLLRAESELGVQGTLYESHSPGDYAVYLQQCADEGNALCISVGWLMGDATLAAAQNNPATHFAIVDHNWESYPDNLRGMKFAVEQAAYLAGTLAGLMTKSDVVGGVGGMEIPPVVALVDPYHYGAQCANSRADVIITYTGTFYDPDLGALVAQAQMDQGADVIFGAAGPTGNGAILTAAQAGAWAIGVDVDQWVTVFGSGSVPGSDRLLTSVMKRLDNAVYYTIADEVKGAFTPGTVVYDLAVDGVGLAPFHEAGPSVPRFVRSRLDVVKRGLLRGTIDPWQACAATRSIRVPANTEWVNSGMLVEQGRVVYLDTQGVAITAPLKGYPGAISGPDGQVWNLGCGAYEGAPPPCALDYAPYGALVGRVGPDGDPFLIGGASSFNPPASGPLYLTVNDNLGFYSDNLAGFTVLFSGE